MRITFLQLVKFLGPLFNLRKLIFIRRLRSSHHRITNLLHLILLAADRSLRLKNSFINRIAMLPRNMIRLVVLNSVHLR